MRLLLLLLLPLLLIPLPLQSQDAPISDRGVEINFPELITFRAQLAPGVTPEQVTLEYGVLRRTCGDEVIALAVPQPDPENPSNVAWTWDMNASGSLPPGATIWYRWRVDTGEGTAVSDTVEVRWLADADQWRQISRSGVNLYWYAGEQAFAEDLHATAVRAVSQLTGLIGVQPDRPIDLFIYADSEAMQAALLGAPGWAGGVAFPDYNITIIGISPEIIEWGRSTITHELTHLLIGQLGGPCGGLVPTWLNEGIAVYNEGDLDPRSEILLREAITADTVLGARALSGAFSAHAERAGIAYAQSYSMVRYLIDTFGRDRLLALFTAISNGSTIDAAMVQIYGFDQNGLDVRWRAAVGASERPPLIPQPTVVATIAPLEAVAIGRMPVPTVLPTAVPTTPAVAVVPETQPITAPVAAPPFLPLLIAVIVFLIGSGLSGYAGWQLAASYRTEHSLRGRK
ncbi:MAG: hypothetical protein HC822_03970 [Oscillochloris sp.]|nr:hypothetical protein [Oscillochloris sp.]